MKKFLASVLMISSVAFAWEAPELPGNVCFNDKCTQKMKDIVADFEAHPHPPEYIPGMYSGSCYYIQSL